MRSIGLCSPSAELEIWLPELAREIGHKQVELELTRLPWAGDRSPDSGLQQALSQHRPAALLCLSSYADPFLQEINRVCWAQRLPLVFAGQKAGTFQIGPGVVFGHTACLACLEDQEQYFPTRRREGAGIPEERLPLPPVAHLSPYLVRELLAFIEQAATSTLLRNRLVRIDLETGALRRFQAFKSPTCRVCSFWARYPSEVIHINQHRSEH